MGGWMIGVWVDGKKGKWMGGWVAFEDSTDMLHSFPWSHHYYPIFASYITILFAINNTPGNDTLVNNSADIDPLVNERKMN